MNGKMNWWETLPFLQDEIVEFFLLDCTQGSKLSDEARRCGMTARPMDYETFLAIAPTLDVAPDLLCFHVEKSRVPLPGGDYRGGWMFIFRPDAITPEVARALWPEMRLNSFAAGCVWSN